MKNPLSLLFLLLTTLAVRSQSLRFDHSTHNFGTIEETAGKVSHAFAYTNSSDRPVVIVDVAVSCGCTTPRFSREPLAPGARAVLTIEFDPINRPGRINKKTYVVTNAGNFSLTIDGIVNPRPRSLIERYPFGVGGGARIDGLGHYSLQVPIGKKITAEIGIANTGSAVPVTVEIDDRQLPVELSATITEQLLAAGDEAKIAFSVRGAKYGAFSYSVPLTINGQRTAETITLSGAVVDDFASLDDDQLMRSPRAQFSTYYYRFGTVAPGVCQQATIEITNTGRSPLIIRDVESSAQVEAKIDRTTIGVGAKAKLTLNYVQSQRGYDSGSVRLIVNDPRNPTPELRFVATVE